MKNLALANGNFLPYKVHVELDVLRSFVMHWIGAHIASRDIVAEHDRGLGQWTVQLAKQLPEPSAFSHGICDAAVLRFGAGSGNCCLSFGGPRYQRVPHEHTEAQC